jgi:hypothetical protein
MIMRCAAYNIKMKTYVTSAVSIDQEDMTQHTMGTFGWVKGGVYRTPYTYSDRDRTVSGQICWQNGRTAIVRGGRTRQNCFKPFLAVKHVCKTNSSQFTMSKIFQNIHNYWPRFPINGSL